MEKFRNLIPGPPTILETPPKECLINQILLNTHQDILASRNQDVRNCYRAIGQAEDNLRKAQEDLQRAENIDSIMDEFFAAAPRWMTTEECEEMKEDVEFQLNLADTYA